MADEVLSILIVDDNRAALTGLERDLAPLGVRLSILQDGHQLLDRVRVERPDVVLLDALLPGLSGFDLCKQIKTTPDVKGTMVVILTGVYVKAQYRDDAINTFKADGFMTKPCRPTELQRHMLRLLAKKYKTTPAELQRALKNQGREGSPVATAPIIVRESPAKKSWLQRIFGRKSDGPESSGALLSRSEPEAEADTGMPTPLASGSVESFAEPLSVTALDDDEAPVEPPEPAPPIASQAHPTTESMEEVLFVQGGESDGPREGEDSVAPDAAPSATVESNQVVGASEITGKDEVAPAAEAPPEEAEPTEHADPDGTGTTVPIPAIEVVPAALEEKDAVDPGAEDQAEPEMPPSPLTPGLPVFPESLFFEQVRRELARSRRSGSPLTLLVIRVDDLAQIAELFGVETKNRVLSHVAELAVEVAREVDMAGLLLSLELVGLAAFACDRYGASRISARILKANARRPFSLGEALPAIIPSLRFGLSTYAADAQDFDGLLKGAREELMTTR